MDDKGVTATTRYYYKDTGGKKGPHIFYTSCILDTPISLYFSKVSLDFNMRISVL